MKLINEFQDGERIVTQLMVASSLKGVTNNGLTYLTIEFRDSTGSINGKKWEVTPQDEELFQVGAVVEVTADVIFYKTSLQLKVLSAIMLKDNEIDPIRFIKAPPIPKEELIQRLQSHISSIKNKECRAIVDAVIETYGKKVYEYPAAVSVHHEYSSGLLHHTVSMADIAKMLADYYKDVDKDVLISGVILHDIGKTIEFEGPVVFHYSLEGKLVGHISIMAGIIKETADKLNIKGETPILLEHMVLSHHGEYEFGSPVLPLTKEAILLNLIDNIDSKMAIVTKALEDVKPGEFSQRIFPLDNRTIYKPMGK